MDSSTEGNECNFLSILYVLLQYLMCTLSNRKYLMNAKNINGLAQWLSDKESTCNAGDVGSTPGSEDSLEEGGATHSSILARQVQ